MRGGRWLYVYDHAARDLSKRMVRTSMATRYVDGRRCTFISRRQLHGVTALKATAWRSSASRDNIIATKAGRTPTVSSPLTVGDGSRLGSTDKKGPARTSG